MTTQINALRILESYFGEGNVSKLNHWKFSLRHSYYYGVRGGSEHFCNRVRKDLAGVEGFEILEHSDTFQAWPKLSYYEVILHITDTTKFFQGPAEVEVEAPEVVLEREPMTAEPVTNLFDLAPEFKDRKSWRKAVRGLVAHLSTEYMMENGCYYITLNGITYELALTEDLKAVVTQKNS